MHILIRPLATPRAPIRRLPKHELRLQLPALGQSPRLADPLAEFGAVVVVLQVAAQALGFERAPRDELVHAGAVVGPCGGGRGVSEVRCRDGERSGEGWGIE